MGNVFWQGTTDAWSTAANWSGAAVPITDDNVIIPKESTQAIQTGITTQGAVDLDSLIIDEGYAQAIGASGNALTISADKVFHFGSGALWYTDGAGTTDLVVIACAHPDVQVTLSGATITRLICLRGNVTVDGSGTVTDVEVGYIEDQANDVKLTFASGATISTSLTAYAGNIFYNSANTIATANLWGSARFQTANNAGTITTLNTGPNTTCIYNCSGTITTARIAGLLDLMQSSKAKTITTLFRYPSAKWRINQTTGLHTITTDHNLAARYKD